MILEKAKAEFDNAIDLPVTIILDTLKFLFKISFKLLKILPFLIFCVLAIWLFIAFPIYVIAFCLIIIMLRVFIT